MDGLASALKQLLNAQTCTTHREVFKALDFTGESDVEGLTNSFKQWLRQPYHTFARI